MAVNWSGCHTPSFGDGMQTVCAAMFLNQKFLHKFLTQSLTQKDESPGKPSDLDMFELFYQPEVMQLLLTRASPRLRSPLHVSPGARQVVAQLRRWFKLEAPSGYLGEYQVVQ